MKFHYHLSIDHFLIVGFSALVFLNLWQLLAFWLTARSWKPAHMAGTAMGAVSSFGVNRRAA